MVDRWRWVKRILNDLLRLTKEIKHLSTVQTICSGGFTSKLADGWITLGIHNSGNLLPQLFGGRHKTKRSSVIVSFNVIPSSLLTFITPEGLKPLTIQRHGSVGGNQ